MNGIFGRFSTRIICFITPTTTQKLRNKQFSTRKMSGMLVAPAVERNKQPILEVLEQYYDKDFNGKILEISSGTGGHIIHFAQHFTEATFQPSEVDPRSLHSIVAYIDHYRPENVRVPLFIDITLSPDRWALPEDYGPGTLDLIININMIHISSNAAVSGLFKAAQGILKKDGRLITYGPYGFDGKISPESNVSFDNTLRSQNPEWGLRQIDELAAEAEKNSLKITKIHSMPANNHMIIFDKVN